MEKALEIAFQRLEKALQALEQIVNKPMETDRSNIDASIQRFEFSIELFWKVLKKIIESQGGKASFPKEVFGQAYEAELIDDEKMWLQMLNDRNQTLHTYDEELANRIYENIKSYSPFMTKTFIQLKQKFLN